MIKTYRVYGEYGPVADMCIERYYKAKTAENAKTRFIREIKKEFPHLWKYIGEHNVYIDGP